LITQRSFLYELLSAAPFLAIPLELVTVMPQNDYLNRPFPQFVTKSRNKNSERADPRGTSKHFLEET
jgi:hypothetical protein